MKLPTILTVFRIVLVPVFFVAYYLPTQYSGILAATIFGIACFTDMFDGMLARKLNQMTAFGAFLDPVADKLIVSTALIVLVANPHLHYLSLPAAIIIGREIVVSALREWMAELGKRANVSVSGIGKIKTVLQMIALIGLLACSPIDLGWLFYYSSYIYFYGAAVLTLWSMVIYLKAAWPEFIKSM